MQEATTIGTPQNRPSSIVAPQNKPSSINLRLSKNQRIKPVSNSGTQVPPLLLENPPFGGGKNKEVVRIAKTVENFATGTAPKLGVL